MENSVSSDWQTQPKEINDNFTIELHIRISVFNIKHREANDAGARQPKKFKLMLGPEWGLLSHTLKAHYEDG